MLNYLREVDRAMQYPPKSFSSCRGIMSLEKKYGRERLIAACACATQKSEYGYQTLRQVLEQGDDADYLPDEDGTSAAVHEQPKVTLHKNIRGREYYNQSKNLNKEDYNGNK